MILEGHSRRDMDMEDGGDALDGRDVAEPDRADSGLELAQSILSKFSMKSLFGFTSKLDSGKPDLEDAVLKAFRNLAVDAEPPRREELGTSTPELEVEAPGPPPDLGNDAQTQRAEESAEPQMEQEGSDGLAKPGISLPGPEPLPPANLDASSEEDVIVVQGTLVDLTQDSDSEDGDDDQEGGHPNICAESPSAAITGPTQRSIEKPGDCQGTVVTGDRNNDDAENDNDEQLSAKGPSGTPQGRGEPGPTELSTGQEHVGEDSPMAPLGVDPNLNASDKDNTHCPKEGPKEGPGEKAFQLPAFFSGLRVLKKGAPAEAGESITEIKPKDGDLALLRLTQPVHKSLGPAGDRRVADLKAPPTFLEQLSQLLNLDMPKADFKTEDPERVPGGDMGCGAAKESHHGDPAEAQSGEVKPKPPETALEAFKALFIRPPKKGSTADASELEALKRKMKHEKESLRAVFERSKARFPDGPSDPRSVCSLGFWVLS